MKRGRRKDVNPSIEYLIHLRLRAGEDDDLINFLNSIPKRRRASGVKSALRVGGVQVAISASLAEDEELAAALENFLK